MKIIGLFVSLIFIFPISLFGQQESSLQVENQFESNNEAFAPSVSNRFNIPEPPTGTFVFDLSDNQVYIKNNLVNNSSTGQGWYNLSASSAAATTTFPGYVTTGNQAFGGTKIISMALSNSSTTTGSDFTISNSNESLQAITPTADLAITLDNTHIPGRIISIVNLSTSKIITLKANNSSVIRTIYPGTTGQVVCISSTPASSSAWEGIGNVNSNWTSFTSTLKGDTSDPSLGSSPTQNGYWRRVGDSIEVQLQIVGGTSASSGSGYYYFPLPLNLTIDTAKLLSGVAGLPPQGTASVSLSV